MVMRFLFSVKKKGCYKEGTHLNMKILHVNAIVLLHITSIETNKQTLKCSIRDLPEETRPVSYGR